MNLLYSFNSAAQHTPSHTRLSTKSHTAQLSSSTRPSSAQHSTVRLGSAKLSSAHLSPAKSSSAQFISARPLTPPSPPSSTGLRTNILTSYSPRGIPFCLRELVTPSPAWRKISSSRARGRVTLESVGSYSGSSPVARFSLTITDAVLTETAAGGGGNWLDRYRHLI